MYIGLCSMTRWSSLQCSHAVLQLSQEVVGVYVAVVMGGEVCTWEMQASAVH